MLTIGATTPDEFANTFEKDRALLRRFARLDIEQTNVNDTKEILKGLQSYYEQFHVIKYSEGTVDKIVDLTDRYIKNKYFPDKALDVMDAAGAKVKLAGRKEVVLQDIVNVVSKISKVNTDLVDVEKKDGYVNLDSRIKQIVYGQDNAIDKLVRAIKRTRVGLKDPKKPIGTFIFLGPTGVGKTELAKVLANNLFDKDDALIRVDMSEYMEKFSISRLVGAPPGYVGYEEGGQLSEKVRRKPYSVILLDEIEKAHPDVFNLLLQILDEGFLTDGLGHKVDFRNTILIMTSNVGARDVQDFGAGIGFETQSRSDNINENLNSTIDKALQRTFNPEFINRLDDIIIFNSLTKEHLYKIIDINLKKLYSKADEIGYSIDLTDKAKDFIIEKGYNPKYGARPLERAIQKHIEDVLAEEILSGKVKKGDLVLADFDKKNNVIKMTKLDPTKNKQKSK